MPTLRSPLFTIVLTVFIALVGFGIVIPLLPIYASRYGASGFEIGLLLMSYSLMQFLLAPVLGKLSDRIGRRPVILVALFITTVSYVMLAYADSLWLLFLSRILAGMGGGDITVAQAYIADVTPPEKRARGMGYFGAAFGFGFMVGPMMGGLLSVHSTALPPLVAAGFTFTTLLYATINLPEPEKHKAREKKSGGRFSNLDRTAAIVINFHFFIVFVQGCMNTMAVLFTHYCFGWTELENGYFMGMIGFFSVTIQGVLVGSLVKRFGQRNLLRFGFLFAGIGIAMIGLSGMAVLHFGTSIDMIQQLYFHNNILISGAGFTISRNLLHASAPLLALLCAGAIINVCGFASSMPSISSLASINAPPDAQGQVLGIFQSAGSLARILAPTIAGFLFDHYMPYTPFFTAFVISILAGIAAWPMLRSVKQS